MIPKLYINKQPLSKAYYLMAYEDTVLLHLRSYSQKPYTFFVTPEVLKEYPSLEPLTPTWLHLDHWIGEIQYIDNYKLLNTREQFDLFIEGVPWYSGLTLELFLLCYSIQS